MDSGRFLTSVGICGLQGVLKAGAPISPKWDAHTSLCGAEEEGL